MNTHPYLRAYMAGIFRPQSVFARSADCVHRVAPGISGTHSHRTRHRLPYGAGSESVRPLECPIRLAAAASPHLPIGFHGALLPVIMAPVGGAAACWLDFLTVGAHGITWFQVITAPYYLITPWFLAGLVLYYLVWKYIVGFLNQVLGIA